MSLEWKISVGGVVAVRVALSKVVENPFDGQDDCGGGGGGYCGYDVGLGFRYFLNGGRSRSGLSL